MKVPSIKTSESSIKTKLVEHLRKQCPDSFVRRIWSGGMSQKGMPDIFFAQHCSPSCWIEMKRPGEQPTPLQAEVHAQMRASGCHVIVADSIQSAVSQLGQIGVFFKQR